MKNAKIVLSHFIYYQKGFQLAESIAILRGTQPIEAILDSS